MSENAVLDFDAPAEQVVEAAKVAIDRHSRLIPKNFNPESDCEAVYAIVAYAKSKQKPLPKFEGVFTTEGSGLGFSAR
jgi:hypothetical protein